MATKLLFTMTAKTQLGTLAAADKPKHKKVRKTLALLETNPRHPSLRTHVYSALEGPNKEKVFEAYVENNTASAYRLFWFYGPAKDTITIVAITPHP